MKKTSIKFIAILLSLLMVISLIPTTGMTVEAAAKPKLAKKSVSIVIGGTSKIKVKNAPKGAKSTYKSAKKSIATVSKHGKVKGIKNGTTKITVSVKKNSKTTKLSYKVTVKKPKLSKTKLYLKSGSTSNLSVKNKPKKATYIWTSSNSQIATVNNNGKVTAKATGTATIKVKFKTTKKTYSLPCKVTVKPASDNSDNVNQTYTVTFDSNGGSSVASQVIEKNTRATRPTDPTRSGYIFNGWFTAASGGQKFDFNTAITENITLYAHWTEIPSEEPTPTPTPVTYTITFDSNGGSSVASQTVKKNTLATRPTDPTRSGYTFNGWFTAASGGQKFDFSTAITENITLYAHWTEIPSEEPTPTPTPVTYTVTFDSNGGSSVASQTVKKNTLATRPTDPTRNGYTFNGWFTAASGGQKFDFNTAITENITLYAKWTNIIDENQPVDSDNDGLTDNEELMLDSDPYVADDLVNDTDGDGLTDYQETYVFKTDIALVDTDGDRLSDYQEAIIVKTDPLKTDTNEDGINDYASDEDGDGLSNGSEVTLGTDPQNMDTDDDGLTDGQESGTYGTSPLEKDTDNDGASDGWEVEHSYNPLVYDSSFHVDKAQNSPDGNISVQVKMDCSGNPDSLQIEPTTMNGLLNENTPGYMGSAFSFNTEGHLNSATISFTFSAAATEDISDPVIYYFNEKTQLLEPLETKIQDNVATAVVYHFSTYVLLDRRTADEVWETEILAPDENSGNDSVVDIAFVIDYSASMNDNDLEYSRLKIVNEFIEKLRPDQDRAAIIKFAAYATTLVPLTTDKTMLKNAVNNITNASSDGCSDSEAGTNGTDGLHAALEQIENSDGNYKYIVFLTDGEDTTSNYTYEELIASAKDHHVVIYSIGMGSADEENLRDIAEQTGGKYFFANAVDMEDTSEGSLLDAFSEIQKTTIDRELDSNGDGISDYYTLLMCQGKLRTGTGVTLFDGVPYETVQSNSDYDKDGLINGEEVIVKYNKAEGKTYIMVSSSPVNVDTDNDGIQDDSDTAPKEKGLVGGVLGEAMLVACKGDNISTVALTGNTGHSYLIYHSFVKDTLDLSEFNRGFTRSIETGNWTDSTEDSEPASSYQMFADDYITLGAGGIYLEDAKCAVYNMETWKHYSKEFAQTNGYNYSYTPNAYITEKVDQKELNDILDEFGNMSSKKYNFVTYQCTHVGLEVWNHVFRTSYEPFGLNTPTNLYSYLENLSGVQYSFNMDNISN